MCDPDDINCIQGYKTFTSRRGCCIIVDNVLKTHADDIGDVLDDADNVEDIGDLDNGGDTDAAADVEAAGGDGEGGDNGDPSEEEG